LYHANGPSNGYDSLNQLTDFRRGTLSDTNGDNVPDTVASASRSQSWAFDVLGDWSTLTTDGTPQSRTHNQQNQVTQVGSSNLTFDNNGNTTTDDNGKTLVSDAWNRLVAYKNGMTVLESYQYDALNRRIVVNPGTATDLYYSTQWQVLDEKVGGVSKAQFVWSPAYVDALVLRDRDADGNPSNGLEERLYAQQDANWNVTALLNTSGSVVERDVYDPYGNPTFLAPSWGTLSASAYAWVHLHQGGGYNTTTGLYSFRHRDMSSLLGRWMETDPIRFRGGDWNLYRYLGNKPTSSTDSSGLQDIPTGPGIDPELDLADYPGEEFYNVAIRPQCKHCWNNFKLGCLGLVKCRLGIPEFSPRPGSKDGTTFNLFHPDIIKQFKVKCCKRYDAAADYANSLKDAVVLVVAAQFDAFMSVKPKPGLGPDEIDPHTVPTVGSGNYASLLYSPKCKCWYWEYMGTGAGGNDFTVKHRPFLHPNDPRPPALGDPKVWPPELMGLPNYGKNTVFCVYTIPGLLPKKWSMRYECR
jgi:RHS repeat-associated protein